MMIPVSDAIESEKKLGFERLESIQGSTFRDNSTVIVVPTRGMIHHKVISSWDNMMKPMNQKIAKLYAVGDEVGVAYNKMVELILGHPELSTYKYLLSLEDDNVIPRDALMRLIESIETGPFAASAGIYFTKGEVNMPMAYGDPKEFANSGVLDFRPRNIAEGIKHGNLIEVNGVGMGCTLWRMEIFRKITPPWFVTVNEVFPDKGVSAMTQDLYFCEKMRRAAMRIVVDLRVKVGHLDTATGELY